MKHQLEQLLDGCLTQLNNGADLEMVLAAHPEVADELRPLLATAVTTQVDIPPPRHKAERKAEFLTQVATHRRLVEAMDGYVSELKAGVPLDDILAEAPVGLRPLIAAASRMHATAAPVPSAERRQTGKATLMALAEQKRAALVAETSPSWLARAQHGLAGLAHGLDRAPSRHRRVWSGALGLALAVTVLVVGTVGVGGASANSLPGEAFYHFKRLGESAQMLFAIDPTHRAELNLQFTERRLREMQRLMEANRDVPISVVEDWLRSQSSTWQDIQGLPAAQRASLLRLLMGQVGDGRAWEARLRAVVTDRAALDALLARSEGLTRAADGKSTANPSVLPQAPLQLEPRPVVVEPAPGEAGGADKPDTSARPVLIAPPAAVDNPASTTAVQEAPPMLAPPVDDSGDNNSDHRHNSGGAAPPPPAAGSDETPAAPPIIAPPLDDPNAVTPGTNGSGNAPGSQGPSPVAP